VLGEGALLSATGVGGLAALRAAASAIKHMVYAARLKAAEAANYCLDNDCPQSRARCAVGMGAKHSKGEGECPKRGSAPHPISPTPLSSRLLFTSLFTLCLHTLPSLVRVIQGKHLVRGRVRPPGRAQSGELEGGALREE
jgi:hypothetical protein